jgi:hypothetical protein
MKEEFTTLPEVVTNLPVGIPGMTATLVVRTDKKAIYKRWDGIYEVFRVLIEKPSVVFGKSYPAHESYPGNEEFGSIAWCYHDKALALERYHAL